MSDLFEQYKLYLELTDKTTERRLQTNRFYITIISFLFAILGFKSTLLCSFCKIIPLLIPILGIILSFNWLEKIKTFKNLMKIKFELIIQLEEKLNLELYKLEKQELEKTKNKLFSDIESNLPKITAIIFGAVLLSSVFSCFPLWVHKFFEICQVYKGIFLHLHQ